jgi:thiamine biosynthesis lipoprotein
MDGHTALVRARRRRLKFAVVLLLAAMPVAAGPVRVEKADEAMGSTFSVVVYGDDRAELEAAATAALDEAHRLDQLLSNYLPSSDWSRINRLAALQPVKVSAELFRLLSECLHYSRASEGAFDITVGPLMKVWGFYRGEGLLPDQAAVAKALRRVGYRHLLLDSSAQTVRFDIPDVELDPGGIGKGYAVDRMIEVLKQHGVEVAMVSAGGSSIYGMDAPPEEPRGWHVPIRDPRDPHKAAAEVFLKNMSLSTSGSYEKFFRANGRRYSHIMDPRTGYPAQGASAVSVMAPRTIDSEVWAKPYFILGRGWTASHKAKDFRVFFCEDTERQGCQWLL